MAYTGDGTGTPAEQSHRRTRAERANIAVSGTAGPGWVRSYDRRNGPTQSYAWGIAMGRVFRLANRRLVQPLLRVIETYVTRWDSISTERLPFESTAVSGGAPDPHDAWV